MTKERTTPVRKRLGMFKGINLGGWLSQCDYSDERLATFITEADFDRIASWGADHVRLPVDCDVLMDAQGRLLERGFERIAWAVEACARRGLKLVLDLHRAPGFGWNQVERRVHTELFCGDAVSQARFYSLWEALAQRFGGQPDRVAFELLNELTDPAFAEEWNRMSAQTICRIRAFAPETFILVGGHSYNSPAAVPSLAAPADDRVIYNFHCYDPMPFTHQGAYWVDSLDKSVRIAFADSGTDEVYFERLFAPAIAHAGAMGTTLYCGEYGVIDVAPCEEAVQWLQCIGRVFARHGIPHSIWNYKQLDFGLTDPRWDGLRETLNACL